MKLTAKILFFISFFVQIGYCQESTAVYSDYLSDNYYLIHPSMAGAANCAKIRLTGRQQWFGVDDAPSNQTVSYNGRVGEKSGVGMILLHDKNGYNSQLGGKISYAHHFLFSRNEIDLNQLSFGISAGLVQSRLDETSFDVSDPAINGGIEKSLYYNADIGASYNLVNFYTHFTVKNVVPLKRELYGSTESKNLRKYLWSVGHVFGANERLQFEPSFLFQLTEATKEKTLDLNAKFYKELGSVKLWGGLSYRWGFETISFVEKGKLDYQRLHYVTPIFGANIKQFMISYTYSKLFGTVNFDQGGYHQITLGVNLFCRKGKYDCNCPAIN
jgi:type IX secretion system PorP/SprF family membrane protein